MYKYYLLVNGAVLLRSNNTDEIFNLAERIRKLKGIPGKTRLRIYAREMNPEWYEEWLEDDHDGLLPKQRS